MTHNQAHTHSSSSLLWLWLTSRRCQNFLEAVRVHGNGQESTSLLIRHIKGRQKVLEPSALSEECRSVCDLRDFSPYWVVYSTELDVTDIVRGTERSRTPWYGIQHLHLVVELLSHSLLESGLQTSDIWLVHHRTLKMNLWADWLVFLFSSVMAVGDGQLHASDWWTRGGR